MSLSNSNSQIPPAFGLDNSYISASEHPGSQSFICSRKQSRNMDPLDRPQTSGSQSFISRKSRIQSHKALTQNPYSDTKSQPRAVTAGTVSSIRRRSKIQSRSSHRTARSSFKSKRRSTAATSTSYLSQGKRQLWGINGYQVPKNNYHNHKRKGGKISKQKYVNYLDLAIKAKKDVPPPTKYCKILDWKKNAKGKFSKLKRVTPAMEILKRRNRVPGPGHYKKTDIYQIKGYSGTKGDRISLFDDAKYKSKQVPPAKYSTNQDMVKPRALFRKWINPKTKESISDQIKVKKTNKPGPGTYDTDSAIVKTQYQTVKVNKMVNIKNTRFVDDMCKQKKFVPPVGSYKDTEQAWEKTSKHFSASKRK